MVAKKKARVTAPEGETKAEKFKRLGTKRLANAIKIIGHIGNLSGAGYEYTPAQVGVIEKMLLDAVSNAVNRLKGTKASAATIQL